MYNQAVAWKDSMYCDDGVTNTREHLLLGYDGWEDLPDGTDLYIAPPQVALVAKQMRDAAVSVIENADAKISAFELAEAIAALPTPEVRWRDLTDDDYLELAGQDKFWYLDAETDTMEFCHHEFTKQAIELFKEKNS